MKVLVTGGAGYIGSHCCKALKNAGFEPVVFDNFENGYKEFVQWGEFFEGDCRNADDLEQAFATIKPEAVMHFAAYAYVGESVTKPEKYYRNNVLGSYNLLETMRRHQVNRLIFSSSCATYGIPVKVPISEDHAQNPVNPYGQTKLVMEKMMSDYMAAGHLKFTALRYFNAAGASTEAEIGEKHQPETHLVPLILDAASGRRADVKIFGDDYETDDGTCIRDYIHVEDLADAHLLALKMLESLDEKNSGYAFNLGNGRGFSVLEIIRSAERVTGKKAPFCFAERRVGDPPVLVGNAGLAAEKLGWRPRWTEIDDIISHAWNYHKKAWNL